MKKILAVVGIVLGIIVLLVIAGIIVIFVYFGGQKSTVVNQSLTFQNKLFIPPLLEPTEENGKKIFALTLQQGNKEFFPGKQTQTWGINGDYLGPTIRFHTDDAVAFNVTNNLPETTTIHWHGMELPASMDGGPHQTIAKNETWKPSWQIKQQAATLWYHPHLMGKTGPHVYKGLAGMIIIDDRNSDSLALPKEYGVDDLPLVVQDRKFDKAGQLVYNHKHNNLFESGMLGDTILVNGTIAPYVEVPAKLVRLRVLNGSNARRYNFGFSDNRNFFQIGSDGGLLEKPVERNRLLLTPGERAEIVVDLRTTDEPITLMSYLVGENNTVPKPLQKLFFGETDEMQKFKIIELRPQKGDFATQEIPQKLNTIALLTASAAVRTRTFTLEPSTINGKKMDAARVDEIVRTGDTEIWNVENQSAMYHPFHIHGVQFQILSRDGKEPPAYEQGWKDTVNVDNSEKVQLIVQFKNYSDPHFPYMFHCHILEHEDMGMMGQFVVVDNNITNEEISVQDNKQIEAMPMH